MSSKTVWGIIVATIIILVVAGALYWQLTKEEPAAEKTKQVLENLSEAAKQTTQTPVVEVPSGNPLEKLAPTKNPLEVTNPFKGGYKNPFE